MRLSTSWSITYINWCICSRGGYKMYKCDICEESISPIIEVDDSYKVCDSCYGGGMYTLLTYINNTSHDYYVSEFLPDGYVFYFEHNEDGIYLEVCNDDWERVTSITRDVIREKDIMTLLEEVWA